MNAMHSEASLGPYVIAGALAIVIAILIAARWTSNPRRSEAAQLAAREADLALRHMVGSIIVVFSAEIRSEHMMALAARLARKQRAELLAAYVVEVPLTLPIDATTENEDGEARETLAAAEAIAQRQGVSIRTEILHGRQTSQSVIDLAKREKAHLIVLGSFREGKYNGAPLGKAIEGIAARAKCDVLIGVEGQHGSLLQTGESGVTEESSGSRETVPTQ